MKIKKLYMSPEIKELGTIEKLTHAFGGGASVDSLFFGGNFIGNGLGSVDGIVVPTGPVGP